LTPNQLLNSEISKTAVYVSLFLCSCVYFATLGGIQSLPYYGLHGLLGQDDTSSAHSTVIIESRLLALQSYTRVSYIVYEDND